MFKKFNDIFEAAKIQGFRWDKLKYKFDKRVVKLEFDEYIYLTLVQRYKELSNGSRGRGNN